MGLDDPDQNNTEGRSCGAEAADPERRRQPDFPGMSVADQCPLSVRQTVSLHAYQGGVTQVVQVPPSDLRRKSLELRRMGWTVIRTDAVA